MIEGINDSEFINRLGGREEAGNTIFHKEMTKVLTNIIWLYVNSFLIMGLEVRILGLGCGWYM